MVFSEIGPDDGPTQIRVGSHVPVVRQLAQTGDASTDPYPLPDLEHLPIALATGRRATCSCATRSWSTPPSATGPRSRG